MFNKTTIYLIVFSMLNLLFVVLSQLVTLLNIGPSYQTDALFAGMTIPTIILAIINGSLTNVLIPQFIVAKDIRKCLWQHTYLFFLFSSLTISILVSTCNYWVSIAFPGFDAKTTELTLSIIIVQLLLIPFSIASAIFSAYFNAKSKFIITEAIPASCSLAIFPLLFYMIPKYGVLATSYLYAAKVILTFIIQISLLEKPLFLKRKDLNISDTVNKMKPLLIGSIYYKSGPAIDRNILSHAVSGSMSLFVLSQQLLSMGNIILTKAIVIPQITIMNEIAKNDIGLLKRWLNKKILYLSFISIAMFIITVIIGKPLIKAVFDFAGFVKIDAHELWLLVICLFGIFIGDFCATLISSVFYCLNDTKTPSYISMMTYTLFIPLKFLSFGFLGVYGLAITCSLYSLVNMLTLYLVIYMKEIR